MTNKYKRNNFVVFNFGLLHFKFYHFENSDVLEIENLVRNFKNMLIKYF